VGAARPEYRASVHVAGDALSSHLATAGHGRSQVYIARYRDAAETFGCFDQFIARI